MVKNFNNGKIYKIEPMNGDAGDTYIGSTTKEYLSQRMVAHRSSYKRWLEGDANLVTVYNLFDKYGIHNCQIVLLESVYANTSDELHAREAFYIKSMECVNKYIPGRTIQEYRKDNKDKLNEINKQYYEDNKDKFKYYRDNNKEQIKQYRDDNKVKASQYNKQYQQLNKERLKQYRDDNKDYNKDYMKQYHEDNKDKMSERLKQYREDNKDKVKQYQQLNKDKINENQRKRRALKKL